MLQIRQVKFLSFSWTVTTCLSKSDLCPNDFLQIWQLKFLTFSWTVLTCLFKFETSPNDFLQIWQWKFLTFSWTILTCLFKFETCPNNFLQMRQFILSLLLILTMQKEHFVPWFRLSTPVLQFLAAIFFLELWKGFFYWRFAPT